MKQEFLSQTMFRLISLGVTVLLIYVYFSWQAKKQKKPTKKTAPANPAGETPAVTGFTKIFWIVFYFAVGLGLIAGGFYVWQYTAGHPITFFIGGLIFGFLVCSEGYSLIKPRKK